MPNEPDVIEIVMNPPDLLQRMARYPKELDREMNKTTEAAVLHVWGSVPPYPAKPVGSTYVRMASAGLGGSLGTGEGGGKSGQPDIKTVKRIGQGRYEGRFGTRKYYAPHVIGTLTQAWHMKHWWTMKDVKNKAQAGIQRLFDKMAGRMVKFLGG